MMNQLEKYLRCSGSNMMTFGVVGEIFHRRLKVARLREAAIFDITGRPHCCRIRTSLVLFSVFSNIV